MNKKGFNITILYFLMLGTLVVLLGINFIHPMKVVVDDSLTGLTCDNPSSDFDQATCWALDGFKFLFIGGIVFIGFLIAFNN